MTTKTLMDVEEYLRTSFEDADCEYLEGEIVERNMGELPHGRVQGRLFYLLTQQMSSLKIEAVPEIRIQTRPRRYRVADVAVWRQGFIGDRIPTVPPLLVIEILSSEDRMTRMLPKVQEYLALGVEWVWVIDPDEKKALSFSRQEPGGRLVDELRTEDPAIAIPLESVFTPAA